MAGCRGLLHGCGLTCILVTARMRSAKLKRARQSLEVIVSDGEVKVVAPPRLCEGLIFDTQKRSGQWHQSKVERAEHLPYRPKAQQGPPRTVRYQLSSACSAPIALAVSCCHTRSCVDSWVCPRLVGCALVYYFPGDVQSIRSGRFAGLAALRLVRSRARRPNLIA